MTTAIIRTLPTGEVEISSDMLVVWWTKWKELEDKILKIWDDYLLYAGKYIWELGRQVYIWDKTTPIKLLEFIGQYDPGMQLIFIQENHWYFIIDGMIKEFHHDFAIGAWWEPAVALMRYDPAIETKKIYQVISSMDIFTSEQFSRIIL